MFADGSNEPIAAFGHGFDEQRVLRTIAERVAQMQDAFLHGLGLDHSVGPHAFEELLVSHQPSRVFDEILQDGKRLGRHQNALFALHFVDAPQALVAGVKTEWREFSDRRHEFRLPAAHTAHEPASLSRRAIAVWFQGAGRGFQMKWRRDLLRFRRFTFL
jgi:hypothetical protein